MPEPRMTEEEWTKLANDKQARQKRMAEAAGVDIKDLIEQATEKVVKDHFGSVTARQVADILRDEGYFKQLGIAEPHDPGYRRLALAPTGGADYSPHRHVKGFVTSKQAPGVAENGKFESLGDFARGTNEFVQKRRYQRAVDDRLTVVSKDANSGGLFESGGTTGGFLVPEDLRTQLMYVMLESAFIRPRAMIMPCTTSHTAIPTIYETTHADGTVFGGVTGQWTAEGASVDESQPDFGQTILTSKKLTLFTAVSNELAMDNVVGLDALLSPLFGAAATFFEETTFIQGQGESMPTGILNHPATVTVQPVSNQPNYTLVYDNILQMLAQLLPAAWNKCVWIAHPDMIPLLGQLSIAVGVGGGPVWITWGGASQDIPTTLLGRPIFFSEHASAVGTPGDIILADWSYYVIGDRMAMAMASSPHVRFTSDQTVYRFVERLDAKPWILSSIIPQHGTNPRSPFVVLGARN